jgi:predicted ATPase/DNA-binding SARP family transcriptional activator
MEYRVLGPLEVRDGERSLPLAGAKQRALLALLLVNAGRVVSRDRLIDELWGEQPPETAVTSLQGYVSRLRKLLPAETLLTRPPGYLLEIEPDDLDLRRFELLLAEGREALAQHDAEPAAQLLHEALALWRGPALAEFAFEPFAQAEIGRLEDLRLAAVEERIEADLALGRHAELIGELEALIAENPHRERLRGQLMLALYRSSRQAEALDAYKDARHALVDELGIEPGEKLQELEKLILTHDDSLEVPRDGRTLPRTNLPGQPGPLIGRSRELAEIVSFLRGGKRLVTLTGAGGSGKTRLAIHAAAEVAEEFADGVWFVSLAATNDPTLLESSIAQVMGAPDNLDAYLRARDLLLVLDNLEHLLPDVATTISGLPARILATSRERLAVSAEQEYEVLPLALDDGVALFVARARQLMRSFEPSESVTAIVRRLDGLPLAVELAAARVKVLTPEQIETRLGHSLDLLTSSARDVPARQRTLRTTIDWSYELLDADERLLFTRLAIFAGGFELAAAQRIVGADVDTLHSLVDKSLLRHTPEGRFFMLATIREFALERADQPSEEEALRRHAEYFIELSRDATATGGTAMAKASRDVDNLRSAVKWAQARRDTDLVAQAALVANGVGLPWPETAKWIDAALEDRLLDKETRLDLLRVGATGRYVLGDFEGAVSYAEEAYELAGVLGHEDLQAHALHRIAAALSGMGMMDSARDRLEQGLEIAERAQDVRGITRTLHSMGELERHRGDLVQAERLLTRAIAVAREGGDTTSVVAHALCGLGDTAFAGGDYTRAVTRFCEALVEAERIGHRRSTVYALSGLAASAAATGLVDRAGMLSGAALVQQELLGIQLLDYERATYDEALKRVAGPAFTAAVERGRSLGHTEVVAFALSGVDRE